MIANKLHTTNFFKRIFLLHTEVYFGKYSKIKENKLLIIFYKQNLCEEETTIFGSCSKFSQEKMSCMYSCPFLSHTFLCNELNFLGQKQRKEQKEFNLKWITR